MPAYREDEQMGEEIAALLPYYESRTDIFRAAVDLLYWMHYDEKAQALALDLDMERRPLLAFAIAQLWQREIGEPDRDIFGELDNHEQRLRALEER
jgi:hypothetical protein